MRRRLITRLIVLFSSFAFVAGGEEIAPDDALSAPQIDPQAVYESARASRYTWARFPGFSAKLDVRTNIEASNARLKVGSDFEVEHTLPAGESHPWVEAKLRSVIGHRKPSEALTPKVNIEAGENADDLFVQRADGSGRYHIIDGLIREVYRRSDDSWFEITNVTFHHMDDGQVLPEVTSVTYRDPSTGDIIESRTNDFRWVEVDGFYLPKSCTTVMTAADGARQLREVVFSDHQLNVATAQAPALANQPVLHRPLPEALTSFGATVSGEYLYVFSGHAGEAHGFGRDQLVNHFRRIRFDDPEADWEELAMHEPAQSTALLNDGQFIYRVGGLSFLNSGDDPETNFNSTDYLARYDIERDEWTELTPMPEARSSLDAAILDRHIYVVGGWNLQGDSSRDAPWHDDMLRFNLDDPEAGWESLPGPGYDLRAISVAAHDGKIYAIGGITNRGFIRKTSIFDPQTNSWSEGPELKQDSQMSGFATSAFAVGGDLYQTGASGVVYRLSKDGRDWNVADRLLFPRMFLRLLPVGEDRLIALGGIAADGIGRSAVVESLKVSADAAGDANLISWSVPYQGRAKHSQSLILDGSTLYAFGGNASWEAHDFSEDAFVDEAFAFDILHQQAKRLPDMPMAVQSGMGVVNRLTSEHKTLVVAGGMNFGEDKFGAINSVLSFDPEAETWSILDNRLPASRSMGQAVPYDSAIWFFGGSAAGGHGGLRDSILHWWGDESEVTALPKLELPRARRSFGAAVVGDECFVIGGLGSEMGIESKVDVFHFNDRTWRTAASPKHSRVFPSVCVDGETIYLFGGFSRADGHFAPCGVLEAYDAESNTWTVVSESVPGVDNSMQMFNMSGRLLFFGIDREEDNAANFVLYDPAPAREPQLVEAMGFGGGRGRDESAANARMLMRKDADKDGRLSFDELGQRMLAFAKKADSDGDTFVTFSEAKTALSAEKDEVDQSSDDAGTAEKKANDE